MKRDQPSRDQAWHWLRGFLQQNFDVSPDRISLEADIYQDLDLDSIDAADIVLRYNETFGRTVDVRAFREVRTLAQALATLDH